MPEICIYVIYKLPSRYERTQKTPEKEILRAKRLMKEYYEEKKQGKI